MKKSIAFVVFPGFQIVDLAAATVFEIANTLSGGPYYTISTFSEAGGKVISSGGFGVDSLQFEKRRFDSLIVCGAMETHASSQVFLDFLRNASASSRRTASICTGAFLLAEAGLLDGRRVTTHWDAARKLQRMYPKIKVDENRIFISDGNFWTSAGMTACIDLGLGLKRLSIRSMSSGAKAGSPTQSACAGLFCALMVSRRRQSNARLGWMPLDVGVCSRNLVSARRPPLSAVCVDSRPGIKQCPSLL
jgi:transcriptional regulator GlxA family with amidase domain